MKENPLSFQLKLKHEDFLPATEEEKQSQDFYQISMMK